MKKHHSILYLPFLLVFLVGYAQKFKPKSSGIFIKHQYYSLAYLKKHKQAAWVYYELTPEMIKGNAKRKNNFRPDPFIKMGNAHLKDYKKSGYDKGHLAPAGDMKISDAAMSESFLLSNISPQNPSLNRGAWKKLENLVRKWGLKRKQLVVVTGPIFRNSHQHIGKNNVTIPTAFYKIIYDEKKQTMIGFVMPNQRITAPLKNYIQSVDFIEATTGIDFFPQLEDDLESSLEKLEKITLPI